jgi:hypothetical protein
MPTKLGLKRPGESFFPSVKLFDDLPVIQGCEKVKEKFLVAVGVRKTVDLETIFTRLANDSGDGSQKRWMHMELIKYLASVQNDIPSDDFKKLREARFCPAEAGPKGMESTKASTTLHKVSELFEPREPIRALGLPILQWPGPPGSFRSSSPEARFLSVLGLRTEPSAPELVEMMASNDDRLRTSAMTYFIANHHSNRYGLFDLGQSRKAILPLQGSTQLVTPSGCFTNERASVLGFHILRRDLHDHANVGPLDPSDLSLIGVLTCFRNSVLQETRQSSSVSTVFLPALPKINNRPSPCLATFPLEFQRSAKTVWPSLETHP